MCNMYMRLTFQILLVFSVNKIAQCITGTADISPFRSLIVDRHNEYRRTERAADMRKMEWDTSLARKAEQYANQCRYERPKRNRDYGSNLFFVTGYAKNWHSKRKLVRKALHSWHRAREYFTYGKDCGSACSFVQMIMAQSYRIGCGLGRCGSLSYGRHHVRHTSLLVCYYSPKGKLMGDYPYQRGRACSRCPRDTQCREDLCVTPYSRDAPARIVKPNPPRDSNTAVGPLLPNSGPLADADRQYLLLVHNRIREKQRLAKLEWNTVLELWAKYVIRCDVEYPGPKETYSNFGQIHRSQAVQQLVYEWADEGDNVHVHKDTGCRTARDNEKCNHYTNMMQPRIRRMGCAAKACDSKRQLTCIYDDRYR